MQKAVSLNITGRVQGVGFRYRAMSIAQELNLSGFVKNRYDGSVYSEVCGEDYAVDQFIEWCKQGPPLARVDQVKVSELPLFEQNGFYIK